MPYEPRCHIQAVALRALQDGIVRIATIHDLRREAEQALRPLLVLAERHVGDHAREAPVAILEWVQRDEPEMREAGADQTVEWLGRSIEPVEKAPELRFQALSRRCLEVTFLVPDRAGDDAHRGIAAERSGPDAMQT